MTAVPMTGMTPATPTMSARSRTAPAPGFSSVRTLMLRSPVNPLPIVSPRRACRTHCTMRKASESATVMLAITTASTKPGWLTSP